MHTSSKPHPGDTPNICPLTDHVPLSTPLIYHTQDIYAPKSKEQRRGRVDSILLIMPSIMQILRSTKPRPKQLRRLSKSGSLRSCRPKHRKWIRSRIQPTSRVWLGDRSRCRRSGDLVDMITTSCSFANSIGVSPLRESIGDPNSWKASRLHLDVR